MAWRQARRGGAGGVARVGRQGGRDLPRSGCGAQAALAPHAAARQGREDGDRRLRSHPADALRGKTRRQDMIRLVAPILAALELLAAAMAVHAETMVEKLLRVSGITASPAEMRGQGDVTDAGDVWVVTLGSGAPGALTSGGGYRSPVFAPDGSVFALKGDTVVRVAPGGAATLQKAVGALKLVGFDSKNADELVVLLDSVGAASPLGVLSLK